MARRSTLYSADIANAERVGHHVPPLARGQRRARNKRRFKVAANGCLRPVKTDGRLRLLLGAMIR